MPFKKEGRPRYLTQKMHLESFGTVALLYNYYTSNKLYIIRLSKSIFRVKGYGTVKTIPKSGIFVKPNQIPQNRQITAKTRNGIGNSYIEYLRE